MKKFKIIYLIVIILNLILVFTKGFPANMIIYSYIDTNEMEELGLDTKDFEGICETLRETRGVGVAFFMYRQPDGRIKGSFRGATDVDLSKVAGRLNGGGHKKAAGFSLDNIPMEEAKDIVLKELIKGFEDR